MRAPIVAMATTATPTPMPASAPVLKPLESSLLVEVFVAEAALPEVGAAVVETEFVVVAVLDESVVELLPNVQPTKAREVIVNRLDGGGAWKVSSSGSAQP